MKLPIKSTIKNVQSSKYLVLLPSLKEEKTQKFTTTIFTILALIFFGIFAINPTLSTIANLQKQLSDDKFVESQLQTKINNLSILQRQYSELQNDLPFVISAIPNKPEVTTLTGQIQTLASQLNLSIVNFQTFQVDVSDDLTAKKEFSTFSFGVTTTGSFEDIKNFITRINSIQRIIVLENITISQPTITEGGSGLKLTIKGVAYFKE